MRWLAEYHIKMENTTILSVKDGDGELLVQKSTQKPIIQGSTIAGGLRAVLNDEYNKSMIKDLFGSSNEDENGKSKIIISDGIGHILQKESRTQVKIDPAFGTVAVKDNRGQLVTQSYIVPNTEFQWHARIEGDSKEEIETFETIFLKGLMAIHQNIIKIGSRKSSGAGAFKILEVQKRKVDLHNPKEFFSYLKDELKFECLNIDNLKSFKSDSHEIFSVELATSTPLLIGGSDYYDPNKPDRMHIKDGKGNYIIPGSSIKGVIRQHCSKLANYFNCTEVIEKMFGSEDNNTPKAGRVFFSDIKIEKVKDTLISNRTHIDKFTGGVMEGALVEELPISGELELNISMKSILDEDDNKKAVALLILALKDLSDGSLTLGSGYAIGRGRFNGNVIMHNGHVAIDFIKNQNAYALEFIKHLEV